MSVYYRDEQVTLLLGDALEVLRTLPDASVNCCVTSPPYYGLRDYGVDGQYGLEGSPAEYVETMRKVFAEIRRILAVDGTCWINLGDSYNSISSGQNKPNANWSGGLWKDAKKQRLERSRRTRLPDPSLPAKNVLMIPERVALVLQDDGWILRNKIVWDPMHPMPESVTDRFTASYEHVWLFSRAQRYWFDLDAVREPYAAVQRKSGVNAFASRNTSHVRTATKPYTGPNGSGRNPGEIWRIATRPGNSEHFATFPIDLPLRCIKAGCKPGGTVLDPFSGSGTTGAAARMLGRKYVGIDLNRAYHDLAVKRFAQGVLDFEEGAV